MKIIRRTNWVVSCTFLFATLGAMGQSYALELDGTLSPLESNRYIEFYASDKAAQFEYNRDSELVSVPRGRVNLGFLFNEKRDNVFTAGLALDAKPQIMPDLTLSFGGKLYAGLLAVENADVFGVSIGVQGEYALPSADFPLIIQAGMYYAPDILSFGQSDRIFDWHIKAGLRLRESVTAFIGFRFLQFDTRPGNRKLDNSANIGIRWYSK